ncbi:HAMP domain-containing sensor histidine kinase [Methanolobus mangrovi]|uniref:histidine kinase n=1 Tax=Methanolobus mangrovi TaxID=3072977 RepID=A0AA51UDN2_9EURY|nr:HAMP domain-containing sensor histidine kinase [Methanolobus mangrovi]WMW21282.1 HAMP domain-containing sensor histidine kinase [Methanolobus mangrovi]
MDEKSINTRKEIIHRRIIFDTLLIALATITVLFISSLIGVSSIFFGIFDSVEKWRFGELLVTITFLMAASWIFSFRRCMDVRSAVKEFNSVAIIKEEFISNLRHELKTPLVPIRGYSELLYDETLGETNQRQKESLKKMIASSEKLERLIDSLIFVSAAKSGDIEYTFTTLRIDDVITGAVFELSDQLIQKRQNIEVDIQPGLSFIEGDKKYLLEVLIQLLENATKFSPTEKTIRVVAHEGYKSLHIKIIDEGIGISENEIDNIFERFYQVDGSKTRHYGGNGLGLHIARSITEAHKGKIWIESELGKGTIAHIRLPTPKHGQIKK